MSRAADALRVAFFTDSYAEANGIARLTRALETRAAERGLPFLFVHGGRTTGVVDAGSVRRLELRRSGAAFTLDHDLTFDPFLWRHYRKVRAALAEFRPDVLHVTGPSDVGQLGALLGHRLSIPMVGSWHTNLHQYAALRSARWCRWIPAERRRRALDAIERVALAATVQFYRIPRALLAPNQDLVDMLGRRTGRPTALMKHGVDARMFTPVASPAEGDGIVRIGFVGRFSAEKRVRLLATLQGALRDRGIASQFVFIGDGAERQWLERAMPDALFLGVLTGDELAHAYASLDLFAFPSPSETFGLAVLEAMASGVTVLAMAQGGPGFVVQHDVSGWLAGSDEAFVEAGVMLASDRTLRTRLGRGARARALSWSWDDVLNDLYDTYRTTAGVSSRRCAAPTVESRLPV